MSGTGEVALGRALCAEAMAAPATVAGVAAVAARQSGAALAALAASAALATGGIAVLNRAVVQG